MGRHAAAEPRRLAERLTSRPALSELLSAVVAGALIALGTFNHAIVSTIELFFGMR